MFRNDDATALATEPSIPGPTGATPGFFTSGNPTTGQAATLVPDWWLNMVQEELLGIVSYAGVAPVKTNNGQVINSLLAAFGGAGAATTQGWVKLASGIILQWGTGVTTSGNQDAKNFPTAFPNNVFAIVVTEGNAVGWSTSAPTPTIYGGTRAGASLVLFEVSCTTISRAGVPSFASGCNYNYFAIGN